VPGRFSFADYELDLIERVLRKGGQVVRLSARQLELLALLVQREGTVVTKDELLTFVWPGQVVEENNVAVHVSGLRRVLGRGAIETVSGRGYRFALPISFEPRTPAPADPALPGPSVFEPRDLPSKPEVLHGRSADLRALLTQVTEHRLVTVVGAPGLGKSTLALACAHDSGPRYSDGVVWIGLGRDEMPVGVLVSVAVGLGLDEQASLAEVLDLLRRLEILLVIDNAEVEVDAVATFAHAVLESTERVSMLVTSRRVLRMLGERVFRLPALSAPGG
jgi:DNA-binding winged helix-turn-helix (wHTH) protein